MIKALNRIISIIVDDLKTINKPGLFVLFCALVLLIDYISMLVLVTDDIYFKHLGKQMTYEQIISILDNQLKIQWISYLLLPIFYLIKLFLIAAVLLAGVIFFNIKINFFKLFDITLISEFIFIFPVIIKLLWFSYYKTDYEISDLRAFYPFSLVLS